MTDKTYKVKGVKYELVYTQDNSAPCSKCAFFYDLRCKFPKSYKRRCSRTQGCSKGWDTYEYKKI